MKRLANDEEGAKKRAKITSTSSSQNTQKFTNAEAVRTVLRAQNLDVLTQGLTNLRNQLTIRHDESPISSQDERLLLVQQWLGDGRQTQDIFDIWEKTNSNHAILNALIISLLSAILSLTSIHYAYHAIGHPILKTLLTPTFIRRLNSYIGGSNNELILVSLKLYNSSSTFAGGRERKAVLDAFPWELKSLPKLLSMRRKGKSPDADPFIKPDIRTLYITFVLSFIHEDSSSNVKTSFLEQHRDALLAIFKGLSQDQYILIKRILEVFWTGLWSDLKVKRTMKIGLFNEVTIGHLLKLYERDRSEDEDPSHISADLVHHFLLGLCSRPGFGICFKDRGWYPREQDVDEKVTHDDPDLPIQKSSKIYNKILSNVLRTLKVNEDPRQQELALKIMTACPELVTGYWSAAALTLEPRLSSKWLANIAFFGTIISLPVPSSSFLLTEDSRTGSYQPTPPPLHTILENILPSVNTKSNFSKGLQSPSGLVQHCTALALTKCLMKYDQVLQTFRGVAAELEEDEEEGEWFKRIGDLEKEVRRRVPEFQVVVAFSQHGLVHDAANPQSKGQPITPNATRSSLLAESALRLLWMYHRCLPSLAAEARFDIGKLLQRFSKVPSYEDDEEIEVLDAVERLDRVRRLHVLRLLKESDQFTWTGKLSGTSTQSYIHVLLKSFATAEIVAERTALDELLRHILSQTILFQEDADEPSLWLSALPSTCRSTGSISPDGALLTDEAESVITFFDDCVQRCMKTPYRYIEELQAFVKDTSITTPNDHLACYPSPLLMTVIEQLSAKVGAKLLSPSDTLALASFTRKVVVNLSMKVSNASLLQYLSTKIDAILSEGRLFSEYPALTIAIRREVAILKSYLSRLVRDDSELVHDSVLISGEVADFLREVARLSPPSLLFARANGAYELVDWVRLVGESIGPDEVNCIIDVVKDFYPPAIPAVIESLDPTEHSIWEAIDVEEYVTQFPGSISFQYLYLHADKSALLDEEPRSIISRALMDFPTLLHIKRAVHLILHGLNSTSSQDALHYALVLLLTKIMGDASRVLSVNDINSLKEYIFAQDGNLKSLCIAQDAADSTRDALRQLVRVSLDPVTERNKIITSDICTYWLNVVRTSPDLSNTTVQTAAIWINYFPVLDLYSLLDDLGRSVEEMPSPTHIDLLNAVLAALQQNCTNDIDVAVELRKRLPLLFALQETLQDHTALEDLIATTVGDSLLLYSHSLPALDDIVDSTSLSSAIQLSESRWRYTRASHPDNNVVQRFLGQETWTKSTVKILCSFSYERAIHQDTFAAWLKTDKCQKRPLEEYLPVLASILDKMDVDREYILDSNIDTFVGSFQPLLRIIFDENIAPQSRSTAARCAATIIGLIPGKLTDLIGQILDLVKSSDTRALTQDTLSLVLNIHRKAPTAAKSIITALMDHGLQWLVRQLSDDHHLSGSAKVTVKLLSSLAKIAKDVKGQYVETLLSVIIQNHLKDGEIIGFVILALSSTHLKPLIVNRYLQSILQHPHFPRLCAINGNPEHRDAIINLLWALFNIHPSNTCQVTHVEPLIGVYRATLSSSDMKLYSIFRLFEQERKLSVAALFSRWSTTSSAPSSNFLEALRSFDPNIVMRTCLHFPRWRKLENQSKAPFDNHDVQLYDPLFLILIFGAMLSEFPPSSSIAWVEMFRTNIVSLLVRSLSSKDARIREMSLCHLAALWKSLQVVDMLEKPYVLYILGLLKDTYAQPSEGSPPPLPSYTTLVICHALRGVFYPSNFIYPLTSRFLLQRPELDIRDVPMLYGMLYSSSGDWKKERGWIIKMLADGAMSSDDWRVLKRRHTWDLLASLFQASDTDHSLQKGILEVLANLTCNSQATRSLILKSSLLTWIQMQIHVPSYKEDVAWAKILANIVFLGDADKLENATNGEWRKIVCYCLALLVDPNRCLDPLTLLSFISPTALKLSSLPGAPTFHELEKLLDNALGCLAMFEAKINIPSTPQEDVQDTNPTLPPHSASRLHDTQEQNDTLSTWGRSVEMLWRIAMSFDTKPRSWDALTVRILTWRRIVGSDQSSVGEWARVSVLQNIGHI